MNQHEKNQQVWLVVFASVSTFLFAGAVYGWGPMQLLLEANGNFASRCNNNDYAYAFDSNSNSNSTSTVIANDDRALITVCPDQTAAFLNCKFVSQLTLLTGTLWGILSDKHGNKVLLWGFGLCNIVGIVLLILAVRFPSSIVDGPFLYAAFFLMGLGSTVGGMLTVETGLLFREQQPSSRVISLLNALFDAGAMTYLGLWGLESLLTSTSFSVSSSNPSAVEDEVVVADADGITPNTNTNTNTVLMLIFGGYLFLAVVCIGAYTHFFQAIQATNNSRSRCSRERKQVDNDNPVGANDEKEPEHQEDALSCDTNGEDSNDNIRNAANDRDSEQSTEAISLSRALPPSHSRSYIPIAQRPASDQLKSKAYVLLGIWFSFHTISNLWTLTTARDFLGGLGDDATGNRYLSIFTLLAPVSIIALPFLDVAINRFGFHAALQTVNALAIVHGIVKVAFPNLNAQVVGFVVFTFFRCFLYAVSLSCVASFIGPSAIGKATGTLYFLSGLASFANLGLAHLAVTVQDGDFFVANLVFLVGTIPMVFVTCVVGGALERDQQGCREPELKPESELQHNVATKESSQALPSTREKRGD